jgi:hypothetical protein
MALGIGHDAVYPTSNFIKGEIGEVRLWNVARTQSEIQTFMNTSLPYSNPTNTALPVAYFRLNEGANQTAFSSTSNFQTNARLGSSNTVDANDPTWVNSCVAINKKYGSSFENPVALGNLLQGSSYNSAFDNTSISAMDNDWGQVSDDVFYSFTLTQVSEVTISTCAGSIDTWLHLLGSNKNSIVSLDDNGPMCSGTRSSIKANLNPGTYYVVAEGFSTVSGTAPIQISVGASTGTPIARVAASEKTSSKEVYSEDLSEVESSEILASPNPINSGALHFGFTASYFELRNTNGSVIVSGTNSNELSVDGIQKGIYFLTLDGKTQKIIIQ